MYAKSPHSPLAMSHSGASCLESHCTRSESPQASFTSWIPPEPSRVHLDTTTNYQQIAIRGHRDWWPKTGTRQWMRSFEANDRASLLSCQSKMHSRTSPLSPLSRDWLRYLLNPNCSLTSATVITQPRSIGTDTPAKLILEVLTGNEHV